VSHVYVKNLYASHLYTNNADYGMFDYERVWCMSVCVLTTRASHLCGVWMCVCVCVCVCDD